MLIVEDIARRARGPNNYKADHDNWEPTDGEEQLDAPADATIYGQVVKTKIPKRYNRDGKEKVKAIESLEELLDSLPSLKCHIEDTALNMEEPYEDGKLPIDLMRNMPTMFKRFYVELYYPASVLDSVLFPCLHLHNKENPDNVILPPLKDMHAVTNTILSLNENGEQVMLADNSRTLLVYYGDKPADDPGNYTYCNFVWLTFTELAANGELLSHCVAKMVGLQQKEAKRLGKQLTTYGCAVESEAQFTFFRLDHNRVLEKSRRMVLEKDLLSIVNFLHGILSAIPQALGESLPTRSTRVHFSKEGSKDSDEGVIALEE